MKTDDSVKIGARIRHFRELTGFTQLELSNLVPCEPSTLAHYETGKNLVSMTKLIRISKILNVELYQFFISDTTNVLCPDRLESLSQLLKRANKVQLNLIFTIIKSILELTPLQ